MADDRPSESKLREKQTDYKTDHKTDHKSDHKSDHDHKSEYKSDQRSDHKSDYKSDQKGDHRDKGRGSKASSDGSSVKDSSKRKIWERVIKEDSKEEPTFLQKCMRNKLIVAAVVGVLTAVLLVALNPPMIQDKPKDAVSVPGRSVKKVLAWSALAAGLTLLIPVCLKWYGGASKQA